MIIKFLQEEFSLYKNFIRIVLSKGFLFYYRPLLISWYISLRKFGIKVDNILLIYVIIDFFKKTRVRLNKISAFFHKQVILLILDYPSVSKYWRYWWVIIIPFIIACCFYYLWVFFDFIVIYFILQYLKRRVLWISRFILKFCIIIFILVPSLCIKFILINIRYYYWLFDLSVRRSMPWTVVCAWTKFMYRKSFICGWREVGFLFAFFSLLARKQGALLKGILKSNFWIIIYLFSPKAKSIGYAKARCEYLQHMVTLSVLKYVIFFEEHLSKKFTLKQIIFLLWVVKGQLIWIFKHFFFCDKESFEELRPAPEWWIKAYKQTMPRHYLYFQRRYPDTVNNPMAYRYHKEYEASVDDYWFGWAFSNCLRDPIFEIKKLAKPGHRYLIAKTEAILYIKLLLFISFTLAWFMFFFKHFDYLQEAASSIFPETDTWMMTTYDILTQRGSDPKYIDQVAPIHNQVYAYELCVQPGKALFVYTVVGVVPVAFALYIFDRKRAVLDIPLAQTLQQFSLIWIVVQIFWVLTLCVQDAYCGLMLWWVKESGVYAADINAMFTPFFDNIFFAEYFSIVYQFLFNDLWIYYIQIWSFSTFLLLILAVICYVKLSFFYMLYNVLFSVFIKKIIILLGYIYNTMLL